MKKVTLSLVVCVSAGLPLAVAAAADSQRQAEVAKLGEDVMPFSLQATTHVFTKTADGGVQRVIAKSASDARQVKLVREHLRGIRTEFLKGDFSGPTHIHGAEMPGLAALKAAKPGQVAIDYREVDTGAELTYRTADAKLVAALHQWFDAQLSDHGADAMAGHMQHHDHGAMMKE
jgi:hypothetical protein